MTTATIQTINTAGIEQIRGFLLTNHNEPHLYEGNTATTMKMLQAWVADAEFSLAEGNDAAIELPARNSIHGYTQTFTIDANGIDSEQVEIE